MYPFIYTLNILISLICVYRYIDLLWRVVIRLYMKLSELLDTINDILNCVLILEL